MGMITQPVINNLQMRLNPDSSAKHHSFLPSSQSATQANLNSSSHTSSRNFDYPMPYHGKMIKQSLWNIENEARELRERLQDGDKLPQWVHYKIATAGDRINAVNNYMQYDLATQAKTNPYRYKAILDDPQLKAEPTVKKGIAVTLAGVACMVVGTYLVGFNIIKHH